MERFKVGDKVEVTGLVGYDEDYGVRVGDIAKVVIANYDSEGDRYYIECYNPKWTHQKLKGRREMMRTQIKKVG